MTEWFNVKERLPESNVKVLVWYAETLFGKTRFTYGVSEYDTRLMTWNGCITDGDYVLYWMPLPKAPK